ncbi:hypothetical protein [Nocardioides sp. Root140]|uniref:hypothetical protein n=1 Tax=Nocardioides sp. Root140 TaxID=1736460 RepID=UPI0006FD0282|nr:hypothetical protein [Nocardioides sp. Root140]KQY56567.1 hypothetical protein ASD30_09560 [Nocardioides sp. Root140]
MAKLTRATKVWLAVCLVVLVAIVGTIWWTNRDTRARAEVGQVLPMAPDDVTPDSVPLALPWAIARLRLGDPVDDLPATKLASTPDVRPPEGGSFVPVVVELRAEGVRAVPTTKVGATFPVPELTLVADGAEYPLTGFGDGLQPRDGLVLGPRTVYVAVDGTPEELSLRVAVDGETQTVGADGDLEAGRFAPLYDAAAPGKEFRGDCGPAMWAPGFSSEGDEPTCRLLVPLRVPYAAGLGWAPEGKEWFVAGVAWRRPARVGFQAPAGRLVYTADSLGRATLRIDGQEPAATYFLNETAGGAAIHDVDDPLVAVLAVPEGGDEEHVVDVAGRWPVSVLGEGSPDELTARLSWKIRWQAQKD